MGSEVTKVTEAASTDQRMESGDYIYMSGCPDIPELSELPCNAHESALSYGTDEVQN